MNKLENFIIGLGYAILAAYDAYVALQKTGVWQYVLLLLAIVVTSYAAHYIGKALKDAEKEHE